jgi:hypothetical protein
MHRLLLVIVLALTACAPRPAHVAHGLPSTRGEVRFATSREAFYRGQFVDQVSATTPRVCAGFVHGKKFGHYLRFGAFRLEMTHDVFLGGRAERTGNRVIDWVEGKLLRTMKRDLQLKAGADSYVWCGRLRGDGRWKEGAMRYQFWLRGPERSMDEPAARGVVVVVP